MRINHNMMAMNTHRQLNVVGGDKSKSMEKLSSGYRINRAGDDAAGLAISEKMRAQVRGLNQASRNAQDGISLIQTAEGALTETHSILQRMRELSVQASNDTNVEFDRGALQSEVNQLKDEIDRIGNNTEFNTQNLLDGNPEANTKIIEGTAKLAGGKDAIASTGTLDLSGLDATAINKLTTDGDTLEIGGTTITFGTGAGEVDTTGLDAKGLAAAIKGAVGADIEAVDNGNGTLSFTAKTAGVAGDALKIKSAGGIGVDTTLAGGADAVAAKTEIDLSGLTGDDIVKLQGTSLEIGNTKVEFGTGAGQIDASKIADGTALATAVAGKLAGSSSVGVAAAAGKLTVTAKTGGADGNDIAIKQNAGFEASFQIGANEGQTMKINIADMRSKALGVSDVIITDRENATKAITTINDAINTVSDQRSNLGAVQNRLEHTIKNLDTSSENLQAAESRIRDVDMAKEMMTFTRNNILQQAAQSMLAQANQAPQGVLQLLR